MNNNTEGQGSPALCRFTIAFNENIFLKSQIFPIDSMIIDNGQKSVSCYKFKHIYYMNLHEFW